MKALPPKSNLRYIAHNPTAHLIEVLNKSCKNKKNKSYESNSKSNSR